MDEQLREWAEEERQRMAPAGLETALLGKLRRRRWERRMWWSVPMAAAAAALIFLWRPVTVASPVVVPAPAVVAAIAPLVEKAAMVKPRVVKPKRVEPAPFVAVGAWQAVEPIERGSIVRAQVPRATLASYGMPVGRGRLSEPAPVELLLGEDGTVRGMRLVSSIQ